MTGEELKVIAFAYGCVVWRYEDYSATLIDVCLDERGHSVMEYTFHFAPTSVYAILQKKFRDHHNRGRTQA